MSYIDNMVAVLKAWENDKRIEFRRKEDGNTAEWKPCEAPNWNWKEFEFRIEPEPEDPPPPRRTEFEIARRAYRHEDVYNLVDGDRKYWINQGYEVFAVRAVEEPE